MQQLLGEILIHIRSAWRFRWYGLVSAWVVAVLGWGYVLSMPNVYEAHARVYVDTDSVLRPLLAGITVSSDVMGRVNLMTRALMSRPNLERVARETDLQRRASSPEDFARLVDSLPQRITLDGGGGNAYTIRYSDNDPIMAQRVVKTLLDGFIENTLGLKRADSASAEQFLQKQIREYEERLRTAEDRLAEFKKQNVGMMPGENGDYYTRMQTAMAQLAELRAKSDLATQRQSELTKQLEGEEPTFGILGDTSPAGAGGTAGSGRTAEYRRQLEALLLQYTDKHPRVVALKETIAQLEAQQAAQSAKANAALPGNRAISAANALNINPVYQNLRIELSRTQVELAELREQISAQSATVSGLRSRVDTIPEIEAQLARLNRDYEVNRAQHQALLQRLESARLSERAEESTEGVKFRVLEEPRVPLIPTGPARLLFMNAVLLAAIAAGAGIAFVLSQLRPVFFTRATLATATGLRVIGAVNFLPSPDKQSVLRQEPVLAGLAFGGLLVGYFLCVSAADVAGPMLQSVLR
jgi:polysaccharide chain length determinant protein (PEP-CTERM system associated)